MTPADVLFLCLLYLSLGVYFAAKTLDDDSGDFGEIVYATLKTFFWPIVLIIEYCEKQGIN